MMNNFYLLILIYERTICTNVLNGQKGVLQLETYVEINICSELLEEKQLGMCRVLILLLFNTKINRFIA